MVINVLRNRLAHRLGHELTEEDDHALRAAAAQLTALMDYPDASPLASRVVFRVVVLMTHINGAVLVQLASFGRVDLERHLEMRAAGRHHSGPDGEVAEFGPADFAGAIMGPVGPMWAIVHRTGHLMRVFPKREAAEEAIGRRDGPGDRDGPSAAAPV